MKEEMYTREQVIKMCQQSYMRGMMIQHEVDKRIYGPKPRKAFNEWVEELIDQSPKAPENQSIH